MKQILIYLGVLVVGFLVCFFFFRQTETNTLTVVEKELVPDYRTIVKENEVVKWYERPVKTQHEPTIVYRDRIDTVIQKEFIEKIQDLKVILSVRKQGKNLFVYAYDQKGNILDHLVYTDVQRDFTITSTEDVPNVQSDKFYWNGINLEFDVRRDVRDIPKTQLGNLHKTVGLNSGINYKENLYLKVGAEYDIENKDYLLKTGLKLRLW